MFFSPEKEALGFYLFLRGDVHEGARNDLAGEVLDLLGLEFYEPACQCKEGIIFATLHIFPWVELCATLADDDVSDGNGLVAEYLDAETLGNRITAEGG